MNFLMRKAHRSRVFIAACLALTMGACQTESADQEATDNDGADAMTSSIKGTASYRERIALTPGHTFKVTLSDVSVADRTAPVLAESSRLLENEQVPLSFELEVEGDQFLPNHQYSVRAVLIDPDGNLAWTTDTAYPVNVALEAQNLGMLRLVKAGATDKQSANADPAVQAGVELAGTSWQVEDVASGGVIDKSNLTLVFDENGRLGGSSGCNQYSGEFSVEGSKLTVGKIAGTMMACPPALMDLEQKFLAVLTEAAEFSIDTEKRKLTITAANGQTVVAARVDP